MELKKSETYRNLARAFAGECMARTRYEFVEYGARTQGYDNIAAIIDGVAYQEFNHARMLYTFLQQASKTPIDNIDLSGGFPFREKWTLRDNLRFAAEDEEQEANAVYAPFIDVAKAEGFTEIAVLMKNIADVELAHKALFEDLAQQFETDSLYVKDAPVVWRCNDCGYEMTANRAWTECPLCKAKRGSISLQLNTPVGPAADALIAAKKSVRKGQSATMRN